jgi:hypothetical protein
MDQTIQRLLAQAHLFDDPSAYEAGVRDALKALDRVAQTAPAVQAA